MSLSFISPVRLTVSLATALTLSLTAQEPSADESSDKENSNKSLTPSKPAPDKKPDLKKINETTYQLGKITIDKKKRNISFPATIEITENLIEYLLVNPQGKVHESLFITDASPTNLNIAFKLLGFQENKSLFRAFVNGMPTDKFEENDEEKTAKSYFKIDVNWTDPESKKLVSHNINTLLINEQTKSPLGTAKDVGKWTYGGSFISEGQFVAELNRDIIAVFTDRGAVANYAGTGRDDDTLWFPVTKELPSFGTKVTLVITPEFPAKKK